MIGLDLLNQNWNFFKILFEKEMQIIINIFSKENNIQEMLNSAIYSLVENDRI